MFNPTNICIFRVLKQSGQVNRVKRKGLVVADKKYNVRL